MPRHLIFIALLVLMAPPALAADNTGFIHGTVTLQDGDSHTGFIRWEDEEAFWDDLFHSRQTELPWLEYVDMEELQAERRRRYFESHGMFDRVMWTLSNRGGNPEMDRLFIGQFGYLEEIEVDEEENITLLIRGGERVPVHGYSNDVSSDLLVYPSEGDPVEIEWDDLAGITFTQAPTDAIPFADRLYGNVTSTEGNFEGFIQWDQSECTSIDILDGNNREIPMGDLRSLTKNRQGTSDLVLKNGEAFTLAGSNDVGGGNRGVMVENPEWGRVTVSWKRFLSIDFAEGHGSGRGRDDFPDSTPLVGTVTDIDGTSWTGRLVYDLDEAWSHDIFNGEIRDLEYDIPFGQIRSIEKRDEETCRVSLKSGRVLDLGESQDSGEKHAGVLVFVDDAPRYLPWSRVQAITLAD